jgi:hypothetical protein
MKKLALTLPILFLLLLGLATFAAAQGVPPDYYGDEAAPALLSPDELDDLVAPIALYPDPLIAQILPAATFVDQVDEAARYVRQYGRGPGIDDQPWDLSVKAVAHYPDVLFMMDQKYDWTVALGQAYIDQTQDVMDAIQRLRSDAEQAGNLVSTREQQVIVSQDYISIVPASPDYIYVPSYDPESVYFDQYSAGSPFIAFSAGFLIGPWLSRDCDWRHHRVYYHGWRGGGWVGRSKPHIHDRRGIYINKRASVINVNKRVLQHDTRHFRQELRSDSARRREGRGATAPTPGAARRPGRTPAGGSGGVREPRAEQRPGRAGTRVRPAQGPKTAPAAPAAPRATTPAPGAAPAGNAPKAGVQGTTPAAEVSGHTPVVRPERPRGKGSRPEGTPAPTDVFRGRDVQKTQPASQSGYGGYGSSKDATIYRQRGESSREIMRRQPSGRPGGARTPAPSAPAPVATPASRPMVAPTPRSVAPTPRSTPAPVQRPSMPAPPVARPSAPSAPRPAAAPRPAPPSVQHSAPSGAAPGGTFQRR